MIRKKKPEANKDQAYRAKEERIEMVPWGLFSMAAGVIVWLFQIGKYLYSGEWMSLSVLTILLEADFEWAKSPDSWLGLHYILSQAPLSMTLFAIGVIIIYVATASS